MLVPFLHRPAEIIQKVFILTGLGSDPLLDPLQAWPVYSPLEPSMPDNCLTIGDTQGRDSGRTMVDGEMLLHYGIQIRIRAINERVGFRKGEAIRIKIMEGIYQMRVTLESSIYLVPCLARPSQVLYIGIDNPNSKRSLFTINVTSAIRAL